MGKISLRNPDVFTYDQDGVTFGYVYTARELTKREYHKILRKDPCVYCGRRGGTIEHLVPRSKARNLHENIVGACGDCNHSRGERSPLEMLLAVR